MPNGESKNWIRFCAAIDGFRAKYEHWPLSVGVPLFFIDELKSVLTEKDQTKLASKIDIIGDDSTFNAFDNSGNFYDYGKKGFSQKEPDIRAENWLDVEPDYYD